MSTDQELEECMKRLEALGRSRTLEAARELETVALDRGAQLGVRARALHWLERYPESIPRVASLVDDREQPVEVRTQVIGLMASAASDGNLEVLEAIAGDGTEHWEVRKEALLAHARKKPNPGKQMLLTAIGDSRAESELRYALLASMEQPLDEQSCQQLKQIIENQDPEEDGYVQAEVVELLGGAKGVQDGYFMNLVEASQRREVRRSALAVLGRRDNDRSVRALLRLASDEDIPREVREDICCELAYRSERTKVREMVISRVVSEPRWRVFERIAFHRPVDWRSVLQEFRQELRRSNRRHRAVNAEGIIECIRAATKDPKEPYGAPRLDPEDLREALIGAALGEDDRMVAIFAKLIVEAADRDQSVAGQSINDYQRKNGTKPGELEGLRIAIGGAEALDPILHALEQNLETRFSKPIQELDHATLQMWQRTMKHAQLGFLARLLMSVVLFAVGIWLVVAAGARVLYPGDSSSSILAPTLSGVAGLAMVVLVVYSGPLREIRQSVNDLGRAHASFIAYVHRVLEVSQTFVFYYLQKKITFEEMAKSSGLIKEAMADALASFEVTAIDSSENTLMKVLNRIRAQGEVAGGGPDPQT